MVMQDPVGKIDESIETAAAEPQSFTADGESVTSRALEELIRTRDALATRRVVTGRRSAWKGIVVARGQTPGAGAH